MPESEQKFDYGLGLAGRGYTVSLGKWKYDKNTRRLIFEEGLANMVCEGWRERIAEVDGGRVLVEHPTLIGFSPYSGEPRWDISGCRIILMPKRKTIRQTVREIARELRRDGRELRRDGRKYLQEMIEDIKIVVFGEKADIRDF